MAGVSALVFTSFFPMILLFHIRMGEGHHTYRNLSDNWLARGGGEDY
nr:hypothetical protein Q903MT_gene719 [Picea sitchensis]